MIQAKFAFRGAFAVLSPGLENIKNLLCRVRVIYLYPYCLKSSLISIKFYPALALLNPGSGYVDSFG
jgi:hypothetical protein